jgi:hypothetical protein
MSNILTIRVVEARTLDDEFIEYEVRASDNYEEATLNTYDSLAKLYEAYNSKHQLVNAVIMLDGFESLDYSEDEDGKLVPDEEAPYSGISIEGFHPGVEFTCNEGHPLMYLADNRFRTALVFTSASEREVNAQQVEVSEQVICNNPDCQAHIHPEAKQRVLEEGRNFHRTNPKHR